MCPPRAVVVTPRRVFPAWPRKIRRLCRRFRLPVRLVAPRPVVDRCDFYEFFSPFTRTTLNVDENQGPPLEYFNDWPASLFCQFQYLTISFLVGTKKKWRVIDLCKYDGEDLF